MAADVQAIHAKDALGEPDAIKRLRGVWRGILKSTRHGRILDCAIDPDGVRAEEEQENPNER